MKNFHNLLLVGGCVLLVAALVLSVPLCVFGAGSATSTETVIGGVHRVVIPWIAHTDGTCTATPTAWLTGRILKVTLAPGTPIPSGDYDITLVDNNGAVADVLAGFGADIATNTTAVVCPGMSCTDGTITNVIPYAIDGTVTLGVSNAGSLGQGTITVFLER